MPRLAKLVGPVTLVALVAACGAPRPGFDARWADASACPSAVPAGLPGLCANRESLPLAATTDTCTVFSSPFGSWRCDAPVDGRVVACPDVSAPLWAVEAVRDQQRDGLHVLRGVGLSEAGADDLGPALAAVRASGLPAAGGTVVVEYPSSPGAFERASRGTADATTGAVTIVREGATAVVVNPAHARASDDARAYLLAHELTHALAGTGAWAGPRWLSEGWAEHVAAPLSPAAVSASDAALRAALAGGLPSVLPGDTAFQSGGGEAPYAMARVAVEALVDHLGRDGALAWTADVAAGRQPATGLDSVTAWWRDALVARS